MKTDADTILSEISDAVVKVRARHNGTEPKLFRIHPLDVQMLLKRSPLPEGDDTFAASIKKLMGVPVEQDCGVLRGHPQVDWK